MKGYIYDLVETGNRLIERGRYTHRERKRERRKYKFSMYTKYIEVHSESSPYKF